MNAFTSQLTREITQIRFRPTLGWFNHRADVAHLVESSYEEWRSDKRGNIALYSPNKKEALEIFTDHITHLRESSFDSDNNFEHPSILVKSMVKKFEISEIRRVGFRTTNVFSCEFEFEEIVDILYRTLYKIDPENSPQEGRLLDLVFVLDTLNDNGVKIHSQIGAIKKDEGKKKFITKFGEPISLENDKNIFIDIDVSISSLESPIVEKENLMSIQKKAITTLDNYLELLFED
ncbi:MAG: hypothetical protein U9O78_00030 [Patescibacteria group bacterium]|nr:hypothetical protein [Patescibacteria group bacterium]